MERKTSNPKVNNISQCLILLGTYDAKAELDDMIT